MRIGLIEYGANHDSALHLVHRVFCAHVLMEMCIAFDIEQEMAECLDMPIRIGPNGEALKHAKHGRITLEWRANLSPNEQKLVSAFVLRHPTLTAPNSTQFNPIQPNSTQSDPI